MFCSKCGNQLAEGAVFCSICGTPTAAQASQQPYQQPYPPPPGYYYQAPPPEPDVPNTGINVASFFFPIVGFIVYATSHVQTPIKAKAALKWAIISMVFWVVFGIVVGGLVPLLLMSSLR